MIRHRSTSTSDLPPISRWEDVADPRGAVHIIHGLAEHPGRYERLISTWPGLPVVALGGRAPGTWLQKLVIQNTHNAAFGPDASVTRA